MKLLVSIHDVTPAMQSDVLTLWELCVSKGITPALFVVPNWHGAWTLADHSDFVREIQKFARRGAEIVLHGERHDEAGSARNLTQEIRAIGRTRGEGEFLALTYEAASRRIASGVSCLRKLGLPPVGFVPPAWLDNAQTRRATRDAGFQFTEDDSAVILFPYGTRLRSPVLRWSARTPARAIASCALMRFKSISERESWLIRIALHPQDLSHPATRAALAEALDYWCARRHQWRYGRL